MRNTNISDLEFDDEVNSAITNSIVKSSENTFNNRKSNAEKEEEEFSITENEFIPYLSKRSKSSHDEINRIEELEGNSLKYIKYMVMLANTPEIEEKQFDEIYNRIIRESPEFENYQSLYDPEIYEIQREWNEHFYQNLDEGFDLMFNSVQDYFEGNYMDTPINPEIDYEASKMKDCETAENNQRKITLEESFFSTKPESSLPAPKSIVSEKDIRNRAEKAEFEIETHIRHKIPITLTEDSNIKRVEIIKAGSEMQKEYKKTILNTCKAAANEKDKLKKTEMLRSLNLCMSSMEQVARQNRDILNEEKNLFPYIKDKQQKDDIIRNNNKKFVKNLSVARIITDHLKSVPKKLAINIIQTSGCIYRYVQKKDIELLRKDSIKLHRRYNNLQKKLYESQNTKKGLLKTIFNKNVFEGTIETNRLEKQMGIVRRAMEIKDQMLLHDYLKINMSYQKAISRQKYELSKFQELGINPDPIERQIEKANKEMAKNREDGDNFVRNNISFSRQNIQETFTR